jgi:hypothetical protein
MSPQQSLVSKDNIIKSTKHSRKYEWIVLNLVNLSFEHEDGKPSILNTQDKLPSSSEIFQWKLLENEHYEIRTNLGKTSKSSGSAHPIYSRELWLRHMEDRMTENNV